MATYRFGQGVNVSAGKFNGLSEADEALMEVIQQGKSMTFDMPESDWDLIRQKNEEGLYVSTVERFGSKAYASNAPNAGAEMAPTNLGAQIIDKVNLLSKVRGNHPLVNATSDPFHLPMATGEFKVQVFPAGSAQGQDVTPSEASTDQLTFHHHKVMATAEVTTEFEEDTIKQSMSFLKEKLAKDIARVEEKSIFFNNGATPIAEIIGFDQTKNIVETPEGTKSEQLMQLITQLGKEYQAENENLIIYMDVGAYRQLQLDGKVATVDQYGPKATIVTGELSRTWGVPLSLSDQMDANSAYIAYRSAAIISQRRAVQLRAFPIAGDKTRLEATVRVDMKFPYGVEENGPVAKITLV